MLLGRFNVQFTLDFFELLADRVAGGHLKVGWVHRPLLKKTIYCLGEFRFYRVCISYQDVVHSLGVDTVGQSTCDDSRVEQLAGEGNLGWEDLILAVSPGDLLAEGGLEVVEEFSVV